MTWHVDDLKSSHVDRKVNDEFRKWLDMKYGDDKLGRVRAVRGKRHNYLGMVLDYSTPKKLKLSMKNYIQNMVKEFPEPVEEVKCPWNENLFKTNDDAKQLQKDKADIFHKFVAKGLFASKRARPDILPAITYLCTRVKSPNENDWLKLKRLIGFLKSTEQDVLTLEANNYGKITWHLDAAFGVHNDYKSHTGAIMTLGKGCIQSISTKQKVNARSSTEAELISVDDIISKVMWTKLFLQEQGCKIIENTIYRDNTSSMKMEINGKSSTGKRTRHLDIKYFYITDLIERKEINVEYCPTESMVADYMTKPMTGAKFNKFRRIIMNMD